MSRLCFASQAIGLPPIAIDQRGPAGARNGCWLCMAPLALASARIVGSWVAAHRSPADMVVADRL
jgi:hypothetical protein